MVVAVMSGVFFKSSCIPVTGTISSLIGFFSLEMMFVSKNNNAKAFIREIRTETDLTNK